LGELEGALPLSNNPGETVVVDEGDNSYPVYSRDGNRLLFVSAKRRAHNQAQVYEKNLLTGEERRITFHNGDNAFPQYHPRENLIMYSSSTDELKENPPLLKSGEPVSKLPGPYQRPFEVYTHSPTELQILRVTDHQGFDGEARFVRNQIVWTRARNDHLEIVSTAHPRQAPTRVKLTGPGEVSSYTVSADGKSRAWLEWDAAFGFPKLKLLSGSATAREIAPDAVVNKADLEFSKDGRWLLWAQPEPLSGRHSLWCYDLKTACVRQLTGKDGDRRHPTLSNDGKWLTFSTKRGSRSRIARMPFAPATESCAAAP